MNLAYAGWRRGRRLRTPNAHAQGVVFLRLDRVGDFVLATPMIQALRAHFRAEGVTLAGNELWRDLAIWLNTNQVLGGDLFDHFYPVHPEELVSAAYFAEVAAALRESSAVINLTASRTNAADKLVATHPGNRIGAETDGVNQLRLQRRLNDRRYTRLLPLSGAAAEWERNRDFAAALCGDAGTAARPPLWRVPDELADSALERIERRYPALRRGRPLAVVSPYTSVRLKDWPEQNFAALIRALAGNATVVVAGAEGDRQRAQRLLAAAGSPENTLDLTGEIGLVQLTALIRRASVSVSGDTAAAHIASAVGTPAVVVLGGGHYGRFFPYESPHGAGNNVFLTHAMPCYHCNWTCRYRLMRDTPAPCVAGVPIDAVIGAVEPRLR